MQFCPVCETMLQHSLAETKLELRCKQCGFEQAPTSATVCVYKREIIPSESRDNKHGRLFSFDPSLPRVDGKCGECPGTKFVFHRTSNVTLKTKRYCTQCHCEAVDEKKL